MPTLYEIAKKYKHVGPSGKVTKHSEPIVKGITPEAGGLSPGYRMLTPDQVAALEVPHLRVKNASIDGYQRKESIAHARKLATALARGEEVPPMAVSLNGRGNCVTDGQHTGLAAIIARKSVPALLKHRTEAEQARYFANQRKARKVSPDTIVLAANGLFAEYVQDAVTGDDNAWSDIVGQTSSKNKISPSQMLNLIQVYVGGIITTGRNTLPDDRFDRGAADRLAELLMAFGSRAENPLAWKPMPLRAITAAAMKILRKTGEKPDDIERWHRHMPTFSFAAHSHRTRSPELTRDLIEHWNKRLGSDRRIDG